MNLAFANSTFFKQKEVDFLHLVHITDQTSGSLAEACVVSVMTFLIITFNVLILASLSGSIRSHSMIGYFIMSLAAADLCTGVLLTPLSIFPAYYGYWPYGRAMCKLTAYIEITLWAVAVYTLGWIAVDRYLAIRKPQRYDTIQTRIRCQCWIVFTWITSIFLCSPTLFAQNEVTYVAKVHLCILDLSFMMAYSITLLALILGPTICTLCYCYYFVLKEIAELKKDIKDQEKEALTATAENLNNPTHRMCFVVVVTFALAWLPWFLLLSYEKVFRRVDTPHVHFACLWFGIGGCCWKFPVYCIMSRCLAQFLWSLCDKCRGRKKPEDDAASID